MYLDKYLRRHELYLFNLLQLSISREICNISKIHIFTSKTLKIYFLYQITVLFLFNVIFQLPISLCKKVQIQMNIVYQKTGFKREF